MSQEVTQESPLCPICDGPMALRHGGKGNFWGCKRYPACKGSMDEHEKDRGRIVQMYINMGMRPRATQLEAKDIVGAKADGVIIDEAAKLSNIIDEAAKLPEPKPMNPVMEKFYANKPLADPRLSEDEARKRQAEVDAAAKAKKQAHLDKLKVRAVAVAETLTEKHGEPRKSFQPSKYQQAIFDWVKTVKSGNLVVEALAGSGKTTTGVQLLELLDPDDNIAFVAFNAHIAKELAKRAPKYVQVMTYHSLGYRICRKAWGNDIKVDENGDKVGNILKALIDKETKGYLYSPIRQIVSLVKANLSGTSDSELANIVDHYGIELNGDEELVFAAVQLIIERCKAETGVVDFDDMIWLPLVHELPPVKFDFIFVDEAQDTNRSQMTLALRCIRPDGRIVAVGDRHQSLYGFRGADVNAIPNLIDNLHATVLPLSITYRNPKLVVDLVKSKFPYIPLEAAENAKDGVVKYLSENEAIGMLQEGDMVLCRCNAPLVGPAFQLIRAGKKAMIRGRDIGKGLIVLLRKFRFDDVDELLKALNEYLLKEEQRLIDQNKNQAAQMLRDKVETIMALADGCDEVIDLEHKINTIFKDDNQGVVFSSVHRAKGLEAERVFILQPELMPHPMAKQDWEQVQERNIEYVAYTRTLDTLILVTSSK